VSGLGEKGTSTIQSKMLNRSVRAQSATFQRPVGGKHAASAASRWVVFCLIKCASEPCLHYGMGELELGERSPIRKIRAMKWNTPDWSFGVLAGVLFGHYIALSLVDGIFQPSSDARRLIGLSGLIAFLIVLEVRRWWLRSKNTPASTH
jgi:hypothetical protein